MAITQKSQKNTNRVRVTNKRIEDNLVEDIGNIIEVVNAIPEPVVIPPSRSIKKIWTGFISQPTPSGSLNVFTQSEDGVNFVDSLRVVDGTGVIFKLNFPVLQWDLNNTFILSGDGDINIADGTISYNKTIADFQITSSSEITLRAYSCNDLDGNSVDFQNSLPMRVVIVEFDS